MRFARMAMVAMLGTALLAGCSKQKETPEQTPEANYVEEPAVQPEEAPPPVAEPAPPKTPDPAANIADILPPDEPVAPDAQMLEDADATGLTARMAAPDSTREGKGKASSDPVGDLISNDGAGT